MVEQPTTRKLCFGIKSRLILPVKYRQPAANVQATSHKTFDSEGQAKTNDHPIEITHLMSIQIPRATGGVDAVTSGSFKCSKATFEML